MDKILKPAYEETCVECGNARYFYMDREGGDFVPYGSTSVQLPESQWAMPYDSEEIGRMSQADQDRCCRCMDGWTEEQWQAVLPAVYERMMKIIFEEEQAYFEKYGYPFMDDGGLWETIEERTAAKAAALD